MSEFDKEKEREKLRKKLEREEERRETTEQMSELLLKGATMLNVHCGDCKSPLFRQDGEEFCPSCGKRVPDTEATAEAADEPAPETDDEREAEPTDEEPATTAEPEHQSTPPETNAGEALSAAIARLADRAATAEDPRQAAELMSAARDAAETLSIVENR